MDDKDYLEELRKELEHIVFNLENYPESDKGSLEWRKLKDWYDQTQKEYEKVWDRVYSID